LRIGALTNPPPLTTSTPPLLMMGDLQKMDCTFSEAMNAVIERLMR
jgi:hypothetical protein